jgi:signal transduction histidine kinase
VAGIGSALAGLNRPLSVRSREVAKTVWLALAGASLVVMLLGSVNVVREYGGVCADPARDECRALEALGLPGLAHYGLALIALGSVLLTALPWLAMGWLVFRRKSATVPELVLSLGLAAGGASDVNGHNLRFHFYREAVGTLASEPLAVGLAIVVGFVSQTCVVLVAYLVPDGRFFSRAAAWLAVVWTAHVATNTLYRYPVTAFGDSAFFGTLDLAFTAFAPLSMLFVLWQRLRRVSDRKQRYQLRAIMPSAVSLMVVTAAFGLWTLAIWSGPDTTTLTPVRFATQFLQGFAQSAVAAWFVIAVGLAISRYNLFEIDLVLSRTLVYGGLTASLLALYLAVVLGVGAVFGTSPRFWVPLAATAAVALLLLPIRDALRAAVSRRLYGGRDAAAFEVLAQLTAGLAEHRDLDELTRTVRRAMRVPYARVSVEAGAWRQVAEDGERGDAVRRLPLQVQGRQLGWLEVSFPPGELTDEHEERLLERVADQVALLVQADELASELSRTRRSALESREQERLRLRRDLHDGLGPALAAQSLMAGAARRLLDADPRQANALLGRLEQEIAATLEQARHLIYSLRPPELDQLGLAAALERKVEDLARGTLEVRLATGGDLDALPPPLETAVYRVVTEAVMNVVRHARARRCRVEVTGSPGGVDVTVEDDGVGFAAGRQGVGLNAMRERVAELGGRLEVAPRAARSGTTVRAWFPLAADAFDGASASLEGTA